MLKAKFRAPIVDKNIVSRENLLQKLSKASERKLTLLTAPAGYGKTTVVLDWLKQCGLPVAWISLDSKDDNIGVFWRYVAIALENIENGLCQETEYVFSSQEMLKANIHINLLIDKLSAVKFDFLLVMDDLHYVTDNAILEGLSYLIDYMPEKMHLIIISRNVPQLNPAKHKLKWQIQHLNEKDLRFNEDEIVLFYQARGILLDDEDLRTVQDYTEGWAAGLVAVAMSAGDGGKKDDVLAGLKESNKDIGQYLNNEVISTWSDERRNFVIKTSILETLFAGICNAVTGEDNAQRMLMEIYDANGFLIALDNQKQEYRYHHLFKSFLHELLLKTSPDELRQLHANAGFWFKEQGMLPESVCHFIDGGLYDEALELTENSTGNALRKNDFNRILPWVERLPDEYKRRSLKISGTYALYYADIGQFDLSRQWLDTIKTLREDSIEQQGDKYKLTICTLAEANYYIHKGDSAFVKLLSEAAKNKQLKMPGYHDLNTADIYFYRCPASILVKFFARTPEEFAQVIQGYREMISENPGYAPLAIGEYFYENNRLEEALPYLLKALEEARAANCAGAFVPATVNLARIRRAEGDARGALELLEECENTLKGIGKPHWFYTLSAFKSRLFIDLGNSKKVQDWFTSSKLNFLSEMSKVREYELIVYARALIFKEKYEDARLLLLRLLSFTEENARQHSMTETLILLALLEYRGNDLQKSIAYLETALAIGLKEGYVRSFLDEYVLMAKLLSYYVTRRSKLQEHAQSPELTSYAKDLLKQLQSSIQSLPQKGEIAVGEKLINQLTQQEKRVLELLSEAKTNREISLMLGISLATVKTHTGNIYSKLGVYNRTQCIGLMRREGIADESQFFGQPDSEQMLTNSK